MGNGFYHIDVKQISKLIFINLKLGIIDCILSSTIQNEEKYEITGDNYGGEGAKKSRLNVINEF